MNSIRRPRSRPRVRSVNLRSFRWLITAEAVFRVGRNPLDPTQDNAYRRLLARYDVDALRRLGETALRHFPSRRVQP